MIVNQQYGKFKFQRWYFMWFWWFILICDLLVPFTMLIAGRMMWRHCRNTLMVSSDTGHGVP